MLSKTNVFILLWKIDFLSILLRFKCLPSEEEKKTHIFFIIHLHVVPSVISLWHYLSANTTLIQAG